jgi:glutaminase
VKRLVESGISINSCDYDNRTPLHVAVAERRLEVVKYILSKGGDLEAVDRFGLTPLQVSSMKNFSQRNVGSSSSWSKIG